MADNYLEYQREKYEERKARWLLKKKGISKKTIANKTLQRPDDEAL